MGMGAADVVPGVSGGTIAFITGIYEELINSIRSVPEALKLFFTGKFKAAFEKANIFFMGVLLAGIGTSVVTLAGVITGLLKNYPIPVWSFFFGLILASTVFVAKSMKKMDVQSVVLFLIGTVIAYIITIAAPSETANSNPVIFFSGAIAICAMILPGISGSFILLLMGKYQFIMDSLKSMDFEVIFFFGGGCLVGLLSFARVVSFMFKRFHQATLALLTGFMIGSLNKVWPWKKVLETRINSKGEEVPFLEESISPAAYEEILQQDPQILLSIGLALLGFTLVFGIERISQKLNTKA